MRRDSLLSPADHFFPRNNPCLSLFFGEHLLPVRNLYQIICKVVRVVSEKVDFRVILFVKVRFCFSLGMLSVRLKQIIRKCCKASAECEPVIELIVVLVTGA